MSHLTYLKRIDNIRATYDEDDEAFAVDLLADLLLWCHHNAIDPDRVRRMAVDHFDAERKK